MNLKIYIGRHNLKWIKVALIAIPLVLNFAAGSAKAQDFPKGPVKIIVPFPPGGPTDTVGRLLAQKLQETCLFLSQNAIFYTNTKVSSNHLTLVLLPLPLKL